MFGPGLALRPEVFKELARGPVDRGGRSPHHGAYAAPTYPDTQVGCDTSFSES